VEKQSLRSPIAFLIDLGADILTRWDAQIKGRSGLGEYVQFPHAALTITFSGESPPYLFEGFLYKHYQAVSEEVHRQGRLFCVHSCGNNWNIRACIRDSGIDMLEGDHELSLYPVVTYLNRESTT
jgi:hypothetical protein